MNNNPDAVTLASCNKTASTRSETEESIQKVPRIPPEATISSPTADTTSAIDAFKQEKEISLNDNERIKPEEEFDTSTKNEILANILKSFELFTHEEKDQKVFEMTGKFIRRLEGRPDLNLGPTLHKSEMLFKTAIEHLELLSSTFGDGALKLKYLMENCIQIMKNRPQTWITAEEESTKACEFEILYFNAIKLPEKSRKRRIAVPGKFYGHELIEEQNERPNLIPTRIISESQPRDPRRKLAPPSGNVRNNLIQKHLNNQYIH